MDLKHCPKCDKYKPCTDFYNMTKHHDGKDTYCKTCRHKVTTAYAKTLTGERLERRKNQKLEYYLRKSGRVLSSKD